MTIDLDALESLYISRKFTLGSVPDTVLGLITELRREREKYKYAAIRYQEECNVRDWLAQHFGKIEKCKTCKELSDDIVTTNDCIQCIVEYARKNVEKKGGLITMTIIIKCDCKSEYQDKTYGNRNRVANTCASKNNEKCRCTVCGKEHSMTSSTIVKKNT